MPGIRLNPLREVRAPAAETMPRTGPGDDAHDDACQTSMRIVILDDLYNLKLVDLQTWPEYYEDMLEDISKEAKVFGGVANVWADKTGATASAWLRFAIASEAESFQQCMDQRWFAGQVIKATLCHNKHWIDVGDL